MLAILAMRTDDDRDAAYWKEGGDQVFLVLAEVISVEFVERFADEGGDSRDYTVTLKPVATLTGSIDVSTQGPVTVEFRYIRNFHMDFNQNMIAKVPEEGNFVLVALHTVTDHRTLEKRIVLDTWSNRLMPNGSGLAIVDGPGDPAVWETAARVRAARRPVTQPATRPVVNE